MVSSTSQRILEYLVRDSGNHRNPPMSSRRISHHQRHHERVFRTRWRSLRVSSGSSPSVGRTASNRRWDCLSNTIYSSLRDTFFSSLHGRCYFRCSCIKKKPTYSRKYVITCSNMHAWIYLYIFYVLINLWTSSATASGSATYARKVERGEAPHAVKMMGMKMRWRRMRGRWCWE